MSTRKAITGPDVPYTPALIVRLLRKMPDDRLRACHPHKFQRWPAVHIASVEVIGELISNEIASRR